MGRGQMIAAAVMATTALGCSEIRLKTANTAESVVSSRREVRPGNNVNVRSRIDGVVLVLETSQGCDIVEVETVEIIEEREPDESVIAPLVVLGVAAIPLATGIALIADAPNVSDNDRNAREYNRFGQEGAYAGGIVLTSIGGLIALGPIVHLFRIAAAGEVRTETKTRTGGTVKSNVPCESATRPVRTTVTLRVGGQSIATPGTSRQGYLQLDLADAIPPDIAERAVAVQIVVAGKVVGELAIEPILDVQAERRRDKDDAMWKRLDRVRETCANAPAGDRQACAPVAEYLRRFPDGLHAIEAQALLDEHEAKGPPPDTDKSGKVIAKDPEPEAKDAKTQQAIQQAQEAKKRAEEAAERVRKRACIQACVRSCQNAPDCQKSCVAEVCQ